MDFFHDCSTSFSAAIDRKNSRRVDWTTYRKLSGTWTNTLVELAKYRKLKWDWTLKYLFTMNHNIYHRVMSITESVAVCKQQHLLSIEQIFEHVEVVHHVDFKCMTSEHEFLFQTDLNKKLESKPQCAERYVCDRSNWFETQTTNGYICLLSVSQLSMSHSVDTRNSLAHWRRLL